MEPVTTPRSVPPEASPASLTAAPTATAVNDNARRVDDILHALAYAREHAQVLETLQLELAFPGPREARATGRKPRAARRVAVQFEQRIPGAKRNSSSGLVLEMHAVGASADQKLRLRVDVRPLPGRQDPTLIYVGITAYRWFPDSQDADDEKLTSTPVSSRFDLTMDMPEDPEGADELEPLELSSVQNLGPMLTELQDVWFHERGRGTKPRNVEFLRGGDLTDFWVSSTPDESWVTWQPKLGEPRDTAIEQGGRFLAALVVWRCIAALYAGGESRKPLRQLAGLPEPEEFFAKRPVDLNPSEVREHLTQRKLRVPWHVIEAACTSLNAGKHVIFTGPPGCGKTELAVELALLATRRERDGLVATASPAWSSSELIGRYVPRHSSYGLDFSPGFFLRAIRDRRWLIIDEFNRAPIDACFGELFTVLSGQLVELPFEEQQPSGASARVRVLPAVRESAARGAEGEARTYADYVVPADFRIIGTMNDADRSELSRMSFALLRRFDIIRVDAPDADELAHVIDDAMAAAKQQTELADRGYIFRGMQGGAARLFDSLRDVLRDVFIGEPVRGRRGGRVGGLVSERIVGVATCRDVIAFVAEGLRAPAPPGPIEEHLRRCYFSKEDGSEDKYHPKNLANSYLAMALVLKVFPQLEALDATQRLGAVRRLTKVFEDCTFLRIEPASGEEAEDNSFEIASVQVSRPADLDGDGILSIPEYLIDEMRSQLRGTDEETNYAVLLEPTEQSDDRSESD